MYFQSMFDPHLVSSLTRLETLDLTGDEMLKDEVRVSVGLALLAGTHTQIHAAHAQAQAAGRTPDTYLPMQRKFCSDLSLSVASSAPRWPASHAAADISLCRRQRSARPMLSILADQPALLGSVWIQGTPELVQSDCGKKKKKESIRFAGVMDEHATAGATLFPHVRFSHRLQSHQQLEARYGALHNPPSQLDLT